MADLQEIAKDILLKVIESGNIKCEDYQEGITYVDAVCNAYEKNLKNS